MATETKIKDAIAILADTEEDLANIIKICQPLDIEPLPLKYSEDKGQPLSIDRHVKLVIIAATDAREGERILLRLYRGNGKLLQGEPRTLLLCESDHASDAYASCLEGIFDDYLIFHPLQDADRLRLAVHRGIHHVHGHDGKAVPTAGRAADPHTLIALKTAQSDSRQLSDTTENLCNTTFDKLDQKLSGLPDTLEQQQLLSSKAAYKQAIAFFQQYSQKHLRPILEEARMELQDEFQRMDQRIDSQISRLSNKHHGIRPIQRGQPKVLVIDDDDGFRKTLCQQLMHEGYAVSFAETATKGVALMSREIPNLVLMDLQLPDYRGVESIRLAKKLPMTTDIPIIMMSGQCDDRTIQEAHEAGAVDFLAKPIRYGLLKEILRRYAPSPDK